MRTADDVADAFEKHMGLKPLATIFQTVSHHQTKEAWASMHTMTGDDEKYNGKYYDWLDNPGESVMSPKPLETYPGKVISVEDIEDIDDIKPSSEGTVPQPYQYLYPVSSNPADYQPTAKPTESAQPQVGVLTIFENKGRKFR